jgi:hypothetical protein
MQWIQAILFAWVLMSQVTYEQCTAQGCLPTHQHVVQRLQTFAARTDCEECKHNLAQSTSAKPVAEVTSGGRSLRQYRSYTCTQE